MQSNPIGWLEDRQTVHSEPVPLFRSLTQLERLASVAWVICEDWLTPSRGLLMGGWRGVF